MNKLRVLVRFALCCAVVYFIANGAYQAFQKADLDSSDYFILAVCSSFFANLLQDKKQVKSNG